MADLFSTSKRSEVMSAIRGRGNKSTEGRFIAILKVRRITGWRRHVALAIDPPPAAVRTGKSRPRLPRVRPDFVFPGHRLAVFLDGCFWHSCPKHSVQPSTNEVFWVNKLSANRARDRHVTNALRRRGWRVIRIWEHDLRQRPEVVGTAIDRKLKAAVRGPES